MADTIISEILGARGRRLELTWNSASVLTFTLDTANPVTAAIRELETDVYAWRWDERTGRDVLMFRGVVAQAEHEWTEQTATVNYKCHDYLAMFGRRFLTSDIPTYFLATDQDDIVAGFLDAAINVRATSGASFAPGSFLPLTRYLANDDGTERALSQVTRDRSYLGGQNLGEALTNLANVIGGFDFDCWPRSDVDNVDRLRIWFPYRGQIRDDFALVYGDTVAVLTRTTNSATYGNYWRVLGNAGADDVQLSAENWNADANDVARTAVGLWMSQDNAADVSDVTTLQERADGDVALNGVMVPSYSVQLRPGAYSYGVPNMGDTVPLRISAEGYRDHSDVRVIGIAYVINTDSDEDIELTVGRPSQSLGDYLTQADRDADALVRRSQAQAHLDVTPIGTLLDYAGDPTQPAPPLFLWADGRAFDATLYPDLFTVTGYRYGGAGNAPLLPDTRGRVALGAGQGTGLGNRPVGSVGGAETVAITQAQLAAHGHPIPVMTSTLENQSHTHQLLSPTALLETSVGGGVGNYQVFIGPQINQQTGNASQPHTHNTPAGQNVGPIGNGAAHENMPPYIALPKIIRAAR